MSVQPLVIEAAINGATPKALSPFVPRTPDEIVADACACLAAGAAIVHHHNDEGLLQARHASAPYAAAWQRILERHPDALLYPTMGSGGAHTNIRERYAHVEELADAGALRMALIDPGSREPRRARRAGAAGPGGSRLPEQLRRRALHDRRLLRARSSPPTSRSSSPGSCGWRSRITPRAACRRRRSSSILAAPPCPSVCRATAASLDAYLAMLDGTRLPWMVGVIGGDVASTPLAELAIRRGGHVRVGLEDYVGPRTPRNVELVAEIVALAARSGRPVATSAEASSLFGVPCARSAGPARSALMSASQAPGCAGRMGDAPC